MQREARIAWKARRRGARELSDVSKLKVEDGSLRREFQNEFLIPQKNKDDRNALENARSTSSR
jgi:hypothetical protein